MAGICAEGRAEAALKQCFESPTQESVARGTLPGVLHSLPVPEAACVPCGEGMSCLALAPSLHPFSFSPFPQNLAAVSEMLQPHPPRVAGHLPGSFCTCPAVAFLSFPPDLRQGPDPQE